VKSCSRMPSATVSEVMRTTGFQQGFPDAASHISGQTS
jgi:hypothetical protein